MKLLCSVLLLSAVLVHGQNPNTAAFPGAVATTTDLPVARNNAHTTLAGAINSTATSITLTSGANFPTPVLLTIDNEVIRCTANTGNTYSPCSRGFNGSVAAPHGNLTAVHGNITAWHLNQLAAEVMAVEAASPNATSDRAYSTLDAACTAALAAGNRLYISKAWTVSTFSCAADIMAMKGGVITYTGQMTFSGSFDGDLSIHFIASGTPPTPVFSGATAAFYPQWWGGRGDYIMGGSGTDNCVALTQVAKQAGALVFPQGKYFSSCSVTQPATAQYNGQGRGDDCTSARTCVVFAAGVTGFVDSTTARNSSIRAMWIQSLSTTAGTDSGIWVRDSYFVADSIGVSGFGRDGIYAVTDNVDVMHVSNSLFNNMKGDGWHCGITSDCNVILIENNGAQNNGGIGFHMESGGPATFLQNHTAGNTGGAYDILANSVLALNNYCEAAATFKLRAVYSYVLNPLGGGCTVSNLGGPSNRIDNLPYSDSLGISPLTYSGTPTTPTYYSWHSGSVGNGVLDLHDDTNNLPIWHYNPSTRALTIDALSLVAPTPALQNIDVSQPTVTPGEFIYRSSSTAGSDGAVIEFDGQNGSNARVPYAQSGAFVENNSAGAQDGSYHIKVASAGTLTDALIVKKSGAILAPGLAGGGITPACISNTGLIYRGNCQFPFQVASYQSGALTSNPGTITLYTPAAGGMFRLAINVWYGPAGPGTGTANFQFTCTGEDGVGTSTSIAFSSTQRGVTGLCRQAAGQALQISTSAYSIAGATFHIDATVEQMQ